MVSCTKQFYCLLWGKGFDFRARKITFVTGDYKVGARCHGTFILNTVFKIRKILPADGREEFWFIYGFELKIIKQGIYKITPLFLCVLFSHYIPEIRYRVGRNNTCHIF